MAMVVKVDPKGRLTIPRRLRERLAIEPGDTMFVAWDESAGVLSYAKADNPFDVLADHARSERAGGRTKTLRAFAADNAISLDDA